MGAPGRFDSHALHVQISFDWKVQGRTRRDAAFPVRLRRRRGIHRQSGYVPAVKFNISGKRRRGLRNKQKRRNKRKVSWYSSVCSVILLPYKLSNYEISIARKRDLDSRLTREGLATDRRCNDRVDVSLASERWVQSGVNDVISGASPR